jgi:hypothetical protein
MGLDFFCIMNNANTAYKYIENQGINSLSNDNLRTRIAEMYGRQFKHIDNRETKSRAMINEELVPSI